MKKMLVQNKDLRLLPLLAAGLLLVAAKLVLCSSQQVFLWPDEAVLDDMVMYNGAVSIANGEWLGAYGPLTLAKHSFFSLWLAGLHGAGIPFLLGGQLLWVAAAGSAAWALAPALKKRWLCLLLFALLLFSPATTANPYEVNGYVNIGFVARVYRDNIFPALCTLCVAGALGFALRYQVPLKKSLGWLAVCGLAFAACWLCREDGWWLLPFVAAALIITAVFILRDKATLKSRLLRCAALLLPFALLAGGVLAWCGANYAAYGLFAVNDFSSGSFADAYGAMTRVEHESWDPKIDVPRDVRQKLYAAVPAFAELEPYLESESYLNRYAKEDYNSGSFYWALREAAAAAGYYASAQKAEAYFAGLAADINALCDAGLLPAGPARSSVNPPIRADYVGPVLAEGLHSLWFCATFRQCEPYAIYSPGGNDATFYAEKLAPMEAFLHEKALTVTRENSTLAYHTPWQRLCYLAFDVIRAVYAVATPLALLGALAWLVWGAPRFGARQASRSETAEPTPGEAPQGCRAARAKRGVGGAGVFGRLRRRQRAPEETLTWLIGLGLLGCILLRAFMIAFMTVSSFEIGTYVMYLASVHPLMLMLAVLGCAQLARLVAARRARPGRGQAGAIAAAEAPADGEDGAGGESPAGPAPGKVGEDPAGAVPAEIGEGPVKSAPDGPGEGPSGDLPGNKSEAP